MLVALLTTLLLIGITGLLNAGHTALVSARNNRLESAVSKKQFGARAALRLLENQESVRASCKVAISLSVVAAVVLGGQIVGGGISDGLSELFESQPVVDGLSTFIVVLGIAFLLVVFGDLLPSSIAMRFPEGVARYLSPLLSTIDYVCGPLAKVARIPTVWFVGRGSPEDVSVADVEEDIKDLVDEGQRAGVIDPGESEIISRVFKLDDKPVATLMTPRSDVVFLRIDDDVDSLVKTAATTGHTWFPVLGATEDEIVGIVSIHSLVMLRAAPHNGEASIRAIAVQPLEVPKSLNALQLLQQFRESGDRFSIVRDEYGGIAGIVTVYDVLQVIVGEMGEVTLEERSIIQRDDGSLLVDASTDVRDLFEVLGISQQSPFNGAEFHSLGGFIMTTLGHVPKEGARFDAHGYTFEVLDMDNKRIDKVLVSKAPPQRQAVGS